MGTGIIFVVREPNVVIYGKMGFEVVGEMECEEGVMFAK